MPYYRRNLVVEIFQSMTGLILLGWLAYHYPQVFGVLCILGLVIFLVIRWKNPKGYMAHSGEAGSYSFQRMRRGAFLLWSMGIGMLCGVRGALAQKDPNLKVQLMGQLLSLALYSICSIRINGKRLHDLGKSGWWTLLQFIPGLGFVLWFYLALTQGNIGTNKYGLDPRCTVRDLMP